MAGRIPQRAPAPEYIEYNIMPSTDIIARQIAETAITLGIPHIPGKTKPNANTNWSTPKITQKGAGKALKAHAEAIIL